MRNAAATLSLALLLSACGGGGGGGGGGAAPPAGNTGGGAQTGFAAGTFESSEDFRNVCLSPRAGDTQGTAEDENNWLRSWSNELYLWYDEIDDQDPANFDTPAYFDLMKTNAVTASGAPKDKFHFTIPTEEWEQLSQGGVSAGYGAELALISAAPPREIVVAFVTPNSPAANAGLARGARFIEVDGAAVLNSDDVDTLNAGLFPSALGETHNFVVQDLGSNGTRSITMTSAEITIDPVQFERVITTPGGPVGYLFFSNHIATAEAELIAAVTNLRDAGITDLVLDLRYNGGGFLDIASQLAYMIAGDQAAGQTFDALEFNDKYPNTNPVTGSALAPTAFHRVSQGFGSSPSGQALPELDLSRVFVLTTADTCSASEAIINGLRGINVEVIQIGGTTCGKPYGFYAFDNCGTTYFSIQFRGVNAQGFGDYTDGFSPESGAQVQGTTVPGCFVADDFNNPLSDPAEAQLAAALGYIDSLSCPVSGTSSSAGGIAFRSTPIDNAQAVRRPFRPGALAR